MVQKPQHDLDETFWQEDFAGRGSSQSERFHLCGTAAIGGSGHPTLSSLALSQPSRETSHHRCYVAASVERGVAYEQNSRAWIKLTDIRPIS